MIRFHGGPVTPISAAVELWTGRHAMVSFEHRSQHALAFEVAQSVMIDNGAFSKFNAGEGEVDFDSYVNWVCEWHRHPAYAGSLIVDDIDGSDHDNDNLIARWLQHPSRPIGGIPVWHMHESLERLRYLVHCATCRVYPAVALGSSGQYATIGTDAWWSRMAEAMEVACDEMGRPRCKLHGLRMLDPTVFSHVPLASADSCNVARNIGVDKKWTGAYQPVTAAQRALVLAGRIEHHASAARWSKRSGIQKNLELIG